ncbi:MAG TPA: hypothetical protein IGS53_14750 [Leptolyngbyaceae cyanobacterium M33_DOE_097]|uniref:Type II secretion system protein GspC N-terminal domain-containing protein n=1 Tax=Oscillatoriales cyanobacterium SpSt-418 TaxID=2282169 RepID=A0A7C3KG95_9CYAN|nr:hypothetical protein [Leptolyngbyaceae cyanobacterium M33_DOE_097]
MPQDANRHNPLFSSKKSSSPATVSVASERSARAGGFSVESYADRLMDDLFMDVERSLDMLTERAKDSKAKAAFTGSEPSSDIPPTQTESADPPAQPVMPVETEVPVAIQLHGNSLPELHDPLDEEMLALTNLEEPPKPRVMDRLLLMAGCFSVLLTLGAWLLHQELRQPPGSQVALQNQPAESSDRPLTPGFSEYIQRSLDAIERRTNSQKVAMAPKPAADENPPLTAIAIPGTPTQAPLQQPNSAPTTGLTRVYVPNLPVPTNLLPNGRQTAPTAPFTTAPTATNQVPAAAQPRVANQPVKAPPALTVPGVKRTLRGVVELGDRSAALIEVNGVVQSFRLGESIGSSGWALVEVSKDRMIIRRNGEVRSVSVEQSF